MFLYICAFSERRGDRREIKLRQVSSKGWLLYDQVMEFDRKIFQEARLFHGDLSEHNSRHTEILSRSLLIKIIVMVKRIMITTN
mmetsp:Transcript_18592/g.21312  ORF Transcript_18592/g.21312 Transcript_18592/m.21312 type:complete len:84 (+) Transcript_18592:21-272(+)